jgi:hypothetical protein
MTNIYWESLAREGGSVESPDDQPHAQRKETECHLFVLLPEYREQDHSPGDAGHGQVICRMAPAMVGVSVPGPRT